ncbi:ABC transporter substrate-binding protein [Devosia aurantiaca]|uniref:ABC transporter substrate-binding protein n=1 Tax=Devosia aurantiaca TaxID=2714858 RepID=UPI002E290854|nr:extracellular solute-binding protein [Devosia aurantiaca]
MNWTENKVRCRMEEFQVAGGFAQSGALGDTHPARRVFFSRWVIGTATATASVAMGGSMKTLLIKTGLVGAVSALALSSGMAFAGEVVWWTPNFNEARARELVTKFQETNPDITVNLQITTTDGLPQRVLTALQSGAAPDIIDVQHGWVNGYAQNNLVLPLDDVLQDREDYVPASLDYVTVNDQLFGIPYRIDSWP